MQATFFAGDVRKKEDAVGAVAECVARFGRLDILINSAAGNFLAASEDLSVNAFRTGTPVQPPSLPARPDVTQRLTHHSIKTTLPSAVLEIDAIGTFCMCLAARPYLAKGAPGKEASEGGLILNISATLHYNAAWYQTHLNAAKVCLIRITALLHISNDQLSRVIRISAHPPSRRISIHPPSPPFSLRLRWMPPPATWLWSGAQTTAFAAT